MVQGKENTVTEEEIRQMVDAGGDNGSIDENALYLTPDEEIVPIENGGTGADNAATARENLDIAINGVDTASSAVNSAVAGVAAAESAIAAAL